MSCKEGQRLRDSYLRALANKDAIKISVRYGSVAYQMQAAQHCLVDARLRYWTHIEDHKCLGQSKAGRAEGEACGKD